MNYQTFIHCDGQDGFKSVHSLDMDDAVIENWFAAMWQDDCPAMPFAVPQMQCAILEWRAKWHGPDRDYYEIENQFQDIHDHWMMRLGHKPASYEPDPEKRLPGEHIRFHPVAPTSRCELITALLGRSDTTLAIPSGRYEHGVFENAPLVLPATDDEA